MKIIPVYYKTNSVTANITSTYSQQNNNTDNSEEHNKKNGLHSHTYGKKT
jgi:hypothetical protein